jgi:preprotein translocase subunit SecY
MIIFVGIVSGLPTSLINLFELSRIGTISYFSSLLLITFTLLIIILIVFFEKSFRKIIINSSNQKSQKLHQNNYIPIKINSAGIIPTICANSILFIPASLYNHPNKFLESIFVNFTRGKPLFFILYIFLIYFFSFFYSSMNFNSVEI